MAPTLGNKCIWVHQIYFFSYRYTNLIQQFPQQQCPKISPFKTYCPFWEPRFCLLLSETHSPLRDLSHFNAWFGFYPAMSFWVSCIPPLLKMLFDATTTIRLWKTQQLWHLSCDVVEWPHLLCLSGTDRSQALSHVYPDSSQMWAEEPLGWSTWWRSSPCPLPPIFLTLCLPLKSNPPSKKEERAVSNANNVYNSGEGEEAHIYELSVLVMTGIVVEGKLNDKCAVCACWGKGAGIALGS